MKRDTYHDYITGKEARDAGNAIVLRFIRNIRLRRLAARSGGELVTSGRLNVWNDHNFCQHFSVSFDSSAWTGRRP